MDLRVALERIEHREPRGDRERVRGVGAGLVDRTRGSHALHQSTPPAVGGERHAAAEHLAEQHQVRA